MVYVDSIAWTYAHLTVCTLATCEFWRKCFPHDMSFPAYRTYKVLENRDVWNHKRDTQYDKHYNGRQELVMLSFSQQIH